MKESTQRMLGLGGMASVYLLGSIEYGIIMPSLWTYLQSLDGSQTQLGFCLASFSSARLLALPLVGFWADRRTIKVRMDHRLFLMYLGSYDFHSPGWSDRKPCILVCRSYRASLVDDFGRSADCWCWCRYICENFIVI